MLDLRKEYTEMANTIQKIEQMYPEWDKFKSLPEAIKIHNRNRDLRIKCLEEEVNRLNEELDPGYNQPVERLFNYLAIIAGSIGPDVWDKETSVYAKDISEAIRIIKRDIPVDAAIISIEQTK